VAVQPHVPGKLDAAEDQPAADHQSVEVEPGPYSHERLDGAATPAQFIPVYGSVSADGKPARGGPNGATWEHDFDIRYLRD